MLRRNGQIEDIVLDMHEIDERLCGIMSSLEGTYVDLAGSRALAKQVDDILERLMGSCDAVLMAALENRRRLAPLLRSPNPIRQLLKAEGQRDPNPKCRRQERAPEYT